MHFKLLVYMYVCETVKNYNLEITSCKTLKGDHLYKF